MEMWETFADTEPESGSDNEHAYVSREEERLKRFRRAYDVASTAKFMQSLDKDAAQMMNYLKLQRMKTVQQSTRDAQHEVEDERRRDSELEDERKQTQLEAYAKKHNKQVSKLLSREVFYATHPEDPVRYTDKGLPTGGHIAKLTVGPVCNALTAKCVHMLRGSPNTKKR